VRSSAIKTAIATDARIASVVGAGGWMAGFTGSLFRGAGILHERASRCPGNSALDEEEDHNLLREAKWPRWS
jgi:hypothetical protein